MPPCDLCCRRLLDELGEVDSAGVPTLGGWKALFQDGCVILPWKSGTTNRVAEAFALRLHQISSCRLFDTEHRRMTSAKELAGIQAPQKTA